MVESDRLARGNVLEQLELVVLAQLLEPAPRFLAAHHLAAKRLVGRDDLGHARLDARQILGMERLVAREVVVESVLDRRADGHLSAGVQILDRLGHDVGAVVAQDRQGRLVLGADEAHRGAIGQRPREVPALAVDQHGDRRLAPGRGRSRPRPRARSRRARTSAGCRPAARSSQPDRRPLARSQRWSWRLRLRLGLQTDGWPENVALHKGCQATVVAQFGQYLNNEWHPARPRRPGDGHGW